MRSILLGMALRRIPFGRVSLAGSEPVPAIPVAVLALVMMATTILQSTYWATNLLLYKRGVDTAPGNNLARTDLGNALIDAWLATQGRTPESLIPVEGLLYGCTRGAGRLDDRPVPAL